MQRGAWNFNAFHLHSISKESREAVTEVLKWSFFFFFYLFFFSVQSFISKNVQLKSSSRNQTIKGSPWLHMQDSYLKKALWNGMDLILFTNDFSLEMVWCVCIFFSDAREPVRLEEYFHHLGGPIIPPPKTSSPPPHPPSHCWVIAFSLCFKEAPVTATQPSASIKTHLHTDGSKYSCPYQFSGNHWAKWIQITQRWTPFWIHCETGAATLAQGEKLSLPLSRSLLLTHTHTRDVQKATYAIFFSALCSCLLRGLLWLELETNIGWSSCLHPRPGYLCFFFF